jgi:hypothetical protein
MKALKYGIGLCIAVLLGNHSQAGLNVPYTPDANTLHLWHFDDSTNNQGTANFVTVTDAVMTAGITLTNYGMGSSSTNAEPRTPPYTNIFLVTPSATADLNGCLNILPGGGAAGKAYAWCGTTNNIGGYFTNDTTPFRNPTSGAFTFEALVYIQGNVYSTSIGSEWEIFCGDSQGEAGGRSWQFRMQPGSAPSLNVNFITQTGGTASPNVSPALPTSGPDALSVSNWYHVALTYTGNAPTNGDTAGVLRFYWTYFDRYRTNVDLLASYTNGTWGTLGGGPIPAIGGSARRNNGVGNAGAFEGLIDEVRISDIARGAGDMALIPGGPPNLPLFAKQPSANTLVGYGKTLSVPTLLAGTLPIDSQWQKTNSSAGGWTNEPGQTANTLLFSPVTFGNAGYYRQIATNIAGSATSTVARVTVGAAFSELFNTGINTNGVYDTNLAGSPDPHYILFTSSDVSNLGPSALVWDMAQYPLLRFGGFFANDDGISAWIGPTNNPGGAGYTSPRGTYVYRTTFLLDSVDLTQPVTLQGTWWTGNRGTNIALNGQPLGFTTTADQQNTGFGFTITNGFVPGLNTLDFVVPMTSTGTYQESASRVAVSGIGQALASGLPVITNQPANQTVHNGSVGGQSVATFSVVAVGRPPLSYQWWANNNSVPVTGATNRTLQFINPTAGAQGTSFSVVISNDSGSVTSSVALLTLTTNRPPVLANYSLVCYSNLTVNFDLAAAYYAATDADHDPLSLGAPYWFDVYSTNYGTIMQNGTILTYTPPSSVYIGADEFNYYITDGIAISAGAVNINVVPLLAPTVSSDSLVGGNFILRGLGGAAGGSYHVLSTTNLTLPLTSWTSVGASAFDGTGHFSFTNAMTPGVPYNFYTIEVP